MKISIQWLNDYVDLKGFSVPQISRLLTDIGLEIESVTSESTLPESIVVGEILTAVRHPNADQLQVCTVSITPGKDGKSSPLSSPPPEPLVIVCGAPNARVGIKVAVAQVGSVLPGDFKIKKSKIRGEPSNGMLCSEQELGLSAEHQGILELDPGAPLGAPVVEVLGLGDSVLEVKVTPNRSDCLSYLGIARDLAAKINRPLRQLGGLPSEVDGIIGSINQGKVPLKVSIKGEGVGERFVALVVEGVEARPSPDWIQKRLRSAGMRPINCIVDATNYAMLEFGQPSHAYDLRFVRGGTLGLSALDRPATLETLDGQTRALNPGDLVIVDGEGILGLAGVMGGAASEVREDTTAIVIEVASFSRTMIRKTSKRLGLQSEASYRFERGTDLMSLVKVAFRVAALVKGVPEESLWIEGDGRLFENRGIGPITDVYPDRGSPRVIALRLSFLRQILPQTPALSRETVIGILERLDLEYLDGNDDRLVFQVPTARHDLEREIDLVEEVARIHGYDKILEQVPQMTIRPSVENPLIEFLEDIRTIAAQRRLVEAISFPFHSQEDYRALGVEPGHLFWPRIALENPMSEKFGFLPTNLLPSLMRAAQNNRARGDQGGRLFEVGRGYFKDFGPESGLEASPSWKALATPSSHISYKAKDDRGRPQERLWLTGVLDQPQQVKTWDAPQQTLSFYDGKRVVSEILGAFALRDIRWVAPTGTDIPWLHPGRSSWVMVGQTILGYVGELHPDVAVRWQWGGDSPVVFELMVDGLFRKVEQQRSKGLALQHQFSKYPGVSRDVALLCDGSLTHGQVVAALESFKERRFLESWELFDCYQGPHVATGKKSLAYRFNFRSPDKTLTDPEIEAEVTKVMAWLTDKLGVSQR